MLLTSRLGSDLFDFQKEASEREVRPDPATGAHIGGANERRARDAVGNDGRPRVRSHRTETTSEGSDGGPIGSELEGTN